jgi:methyl-accepting chemotaxis protein
MRQLSFAQRLTLPLIVSLIALVAISAFDAYRNRAIQMSLREAQLQRVTDVAMSIVNEYYSLAQRSSMKETEARLQALERLQALRYGGDGYFTITDSNQIGVMNPTKPSSNGRSMAGVRDANGVLIYEKIVSAGHVPEYEFLPRWQRSVFTQVFLTPIDET